MNEIILLAAILLPAIGGLLQHFIPKFSDNIRKAITTAATFASSALVISLVVFYEGEAFHLFSLGSGLDFVMRLDGLGKFFCVILALLWSLTTVYSYGYFGKEKEYSSSFFVFFLFSYSAVLGVAFSGTLFTMFCFYELLTLCTIPLVLHRMDKASVRATKIYLAYSLGGTVLALAAFIFLKINGVSLDFVSGGIQNFLGDKNIFLVFYLIGFFGFGVKAAVFPFYSWLPAVSAAPTPVTALIHIVAVANSGVFAVMRLTYYVYGASFLDGSWAQNIIMIVTAFTVVFGASMAVKENRFKRRLVYSAIANFSYVLLGVSFISKAGYYGALMHMLSHSIICILAFFCCGAAVNSTRITHVTELNGIGKRMPITFVCFTVAAVSLSGIPPFSSFVSKWDFITAAVDKGSAIGYVCIAALLFSALLTAIYMLSCSIRAFFLKGEHDGEKCEVNSLMTVPMIILAIFGIALGVYSIPIEAWAETIASAVF